MTLKTREDRDSPAARRYREIDAELTSIREEFQKREAKLIAERVENLRALKAAGWNLRQIGELHDPPVTPGRVWAIEQAAPER